MGLKRLAGAVAAAVILTLCLSSLASAEPAESGGVYGTFTILNTYDYVNDDYDRPEDAEWAEDEFFGDFLVNNWWADYVLENAEVTAGRYTSQLTGACKSDFLYSGGHGGGVQDFEPEDPWNACVALHQVEQAGQPADTQHLWLRDSYNGAVDGVCQRTSPYYSRWYGDDSTASKDLEYVWLWSCSTLALANNGTSNWRHAFDKGLNLVLGYDATIPGNHADDTIDPVCLRMFGDSPYTKAYSLWSSFILGSQDVGLSQWAIDGYWNHRYDWIHGATVPPGYTNYRETEYYNDQDVWQWNQHNYQGTPDPLFASGAPERQDLVARVGSFLKGLFVPSRACADNPLLLDEGRFRVICDLDEGEKTLSTYSLQPESFDLGPIADKILAGSPEVISGDNTVTYYDSQNDLVRWEQSGLVTLSREMADLSNATGLDYNAAKTMADEFIAESGGLPAGYRFADASTINVQNICTGGKKSQIAWTFEYRPVVDGLAVANPGGMGISVIVSDDGVYHYRRWAPSIVKRSSSQVTLSAEAALNTAAASLRSAFKQDSVDIQDVKLVYFSPTVLDYEKSGTSDLRPAYRILAKGLDEPVHLDAVDASVISAIN